MRHAPLGCESPGSVMQKFLFALFRVPFLETSPPSGSAGQTVSAAVAVAATAEPKADHDVVLAAIMNGGRALQVALGQLRPHALPQLSPAPHLSKADRLSQLRAAPSLGTGWIYGLDLGGF